MASASSALAIEPYGPECTRYRVAPEAVFTGATSALKPALAIRLAMSCALSAVEKLPTCTYQPGLPAAAGGAFATLAAVCVADASALGDETVTGIAVLEIGAAVFAIGDVLSVAGAAARATGFAAGVGFTGAAAGAAGLANWLDDNAAARGAEGLALFSPEEGSSFEAGMLDPPDAICMSGFEGTASVAGGVAGWVEAPDVVTAPEGAGMDAAADRDFSLVLPPDVGDRAD